MPSANLSLFLLLFFVLFLHSFLSHFHSNAQRHQRLKKKKLISVTGKDKNSPQEQGCSNSRNIQYLVRVSVSHDCQFSVLKIHSVPAKEEVKSNGTKKKKKKGTIGRMSLFYPWFSTRDKIYDVDQVISHLCIKLWEQMGPMS